MFDGISQDELIGEYGLGGGANGDEIDRFDIADESPECTKVLASSTGHSDMFGIVPEDVRFPILNTLGTQTDLIPLDTTYYMGSGGVGYFL
jgi:N,N-dimethylformamidase